MMRTVTTLVIAIILLSLVYALNGAYLIWHAIEMKRLFAYYGVADTVELRIFTIATYFRVFVIVGIFFAIGGTLAFIASIGLLSTKEWARRIWLGLALLLSIINIPWLAWCFLAGKSLVEQMAQGAFTLILTIVSWTLLTTGPMKSIFRLGAAATGIGEMRSEGGVS